MKELLNICVIGVGRAGMVHARNFRWRIPHASLAAIVDNDEEALDKVARKLGMEDCQFNDLSTALTTKTIDAVVITTPTFTHARLALEAAQSGKHILCEKPMALTLNECDQMIAAAKQAGVNLQIGFMRRFDPAFMAAKQQIESGAIGDPLIVRSLTRGPGLPPPWARDPQISNGMLAEVNSHDFDTVRWLAGGNYVQIYAQAAARKAPELLSEFPDFYDTAIVSLKLDNGSLGMIDGVCPAEYGYDARAEVVGSKGTISIGEMRAMPLTTITRLGGINEPHIVSWPIRFRDAYIEEETAFVRSIREGHPPCVQGLDGRCALEAVLAANRSIRTGAPVPIPLPRN